MKQTLLFILIAPILVYSQSGNKLKFIENKGQWPDSVQFRVDLPGGKLYTHQNSFTYHFYDQKKLEELHHNHEHNNSADGIGNHKKSFDPNSTPDLRIRKHAFNIRILNGSTQLVEASQPFEEYYNYYQGNDSQKWASGAKAYESLLYKNVYDGIDMKWYQLGGTLKYDFLVSPNSDYRKIQLQYNGVKSISIKNGHLVIETSVNTILEKAPFIYQIQNGELKKIEGEFQLNNGIVSFKISGKYNKRLPLIIDPQLIFSTFSGSFADNWGNTAAFDTLGNMYSGGTVFDTGFPSTLGEDYNGTSALFEGIDVGILKYSPDGKNLIYGTYVGGFYTDVPYSLVVNSKNELLITGSTSSGNFPLSLNNTPYDATFNGGSTIYPISGLYFRNGSDLFVSKLDANGYYKDGTYIGGTGNDGIQLYGEFLTANYGDQLRGDIIVDDSNNVYVVSSTRSSNFPTLNAYQSAYQGNKDAVVFKLSEDLSTLKWSTYLGGSGEDALYSIQIDSSYGVYVCGGTTSPNFPATTNGYQSTPLGNIDGIVAHITDNGKSLNATYLSTPYYDQAYFVQLDKDQQVYLFGQTRGLYPVSSGVYSNLRGGQFIHALNSTLSSSIFSTTFGSSQLQPNVSPTAFLVNECGNIFISGWGGYINRDYIGGNTMGMATTSDAFRGVSDGNDFYLMVLSANAQSLLYATFFGSNATNDPYDHVDGGTSRFDPKGIIYEAVCAGCGGYNNFPTTLDAHSNTNNSDNCNNASFKFDLNNLLADFDATPSVTCNNYNVVIINKTLGGRSFEWNFGDGQTSNAQNPGNHTYSGPGTYTISLIATDLTTCIGKDTIEKTITIPPILPIEISIRDTSICKGDTIQLQANYNAYYNYQWNQGIYLNDDNIHNPLAFPPNTTIFTLTITDTAGCEASKNVRIDVIDVKPDINFNNLSDCTGKLVGEFQNNTFGINYNWIFGDGTKENNASNLVTHIYPKAGTYVVILNANKDACAFSDTISVTFEDVFLPNLVTPNGDGKNDVYEIKGKTKDWTFEVYNRWGDLLYKNIQYNNEWNGEKLSDGVYYYIIISPNDTKCKGWVQLLR